MSKTILVAIGGNSLIADSQHPDVLHQWDAVRQTCEHLADIIAAGWQPVVTHGNGPQVGYILRRNELAAPAVHMTPLDLIVADTQGSIGYMLQQGLHNELYSRNISRPIVSVVTQVLVDPQDPAFQSPNKPIGGFMSEAEAKRFEAEGWQVMEDAGRGWRRVVASPKPLQVVEEDAIRSLLHSGAIVIAVGGGGIPVVQNTAGELRELKGVFAVIDKDRASSLLACHLDITCLLISTAVERVAIYYNTPRQQWLERMTVAEAESYMAAGHFAPGSMLPKIEAAVAFVRHTGRPAIITNPANLALALDGRTGTHVVPE
jgi:carbamate kinase